METLAAIAARRSVRRYKPGALNREQIETMLRAAMLAPSAGNQQAWHFYVISSRQTLDALSLASPHAGPIKKASLGILVCGDMERERFDGQYWVQDCAMAAQNIMLAAHDIGIGSVYLGLYPLPDRVEKTKQTLNLPGNHIPLTLISLGIPAETHKTPDRWDENKITWA